jgi:peptidoglycan/LPS O-acetylase OafA/YrhL
MGLIRMLLAYAVVISHATAIDIELIPGSVAVQLFFIISGFYMSLVWSTKYSEQGICFFYVNRLLRLFPTYVLVLLISLLFLCMSDVGIFTNVAKMKVALGAGPLVAATLVWTNLGIIGQELLYLLKIDQANGSLSWLFTGADKLEAWKFLLVPQAWSLSMELYFYALVPFILNLRYRWISIIFLASLALRVYIVLKGQELEYLPRRFFPSELCFFLTGVFSYRFLELVRKYNKKKYVTGTLALLIFVSVILYYQRVDFPGALALLACVGFFLMPFIFDLTKNSRLDAFAGKISFPIYMIHFLIIGFFETYWEEYSCLALLATVTCLAMLIYLTFEVHIDKWRRYHITRIDLRLKEDTPLPVGKISEKVFSMSKVACS